MLAITALHVAGWQSALSTCATGEICPANRQLTELPPELEAEVRAREVVKERMQAREREERER